MKVSLDDFKQLVKENKVIVLAQDEKTLEWSQIESKYDYYTSTLEPRFTYADEFFDDDPENDSITEDTYNKMCYDTIERAIDFVYSNYTNKKDFRDGFKNYFSLDYCITYYLQMMMFTQVDNAGKNAMFDTWGDGKLYPRPYDMDTQMGLDNSGYDRIGADAELNRVLSPAGISGKNVTPSAFGEKSNFIPTWDTITSLE
jgi:hypothetical protein